MDLPAKLLIGATIFLICGLSFKAFADDDNKIDVNTTGNQSNDGLVFNVTQIGYDNDTIFTLGGSSNSILIRQEGNNNEISFVDYWGSGEAWGGDLDGNSNTLHFEQFNDGSNKSDIGFHIPGNSNLVRWGQGRVLTGKDDTTFATDGNGESGGHKLNLDIHGSNNDLVGIQNNGTGSDGHTATVYLYSSNNDVWIDQKHGGEHTLYLRTNSSNNEASISQFGEAKKNASVILSGNYGTDLTILQQGSSTQTYSLSNNCQTSGGCTISITQD